MERNIIQIKQPRASYITHENNKSQVKRSDANHKKSVFLNEQLPTFDNDLSDIERPEDKPEYYGFEDKAGAQIPILIEYNSDEFRNCAVWLCRNVSTLREHFIHPDRWTLCLLNHIKGQIGISWADSYISQFPNTRRFSTFWRKFLDRFTIAHPTKQARERLISLKFQSINQFIGQIERIRSAVNKNEEVEELIRETFIEQLPIHIKNQLTTWRIKKEPIDILMKEVEQINIIFEHDQALLASTYQYLDKYDGTANSNTKRQSEISPWSSFVTYVSSTPLTE